MNRRETLADLARSLPWRSNTIDNSQNSQTVKKRRESNVDFSSKSMRTRREQESIESGKIVQKRESHSDKSENYNSENIPTVVC